jgi:hypothetical protein
MLGQASLSDLEYAHKKRRTRRDTFLAEMEAVVKDRTLGGGGAGWLVTRCGPKTLRKSLYL